ncbi:MAG: Spy/CpxP family protein refolding chaperone [Bacteroidota bacterium]
MTEISSRNIQRFLAAATLALAIPLAVVAAPAAHEVGAPDDCMAMAGGMHGRHGDGMGRQAMAGAMGPHYLHRLKLTDAQRDQVFEIMHQQAPEMREKGKALHKAEEELRQLTASADYSEARARTLAEQAGKAMADITLARSKADRQIFDVLTPEQRKRLSEIKPEGEARDPRD